MVNRKKKNLIVIAMAVVLSCFIGAKAHAIEIVNIPYTFDYYGYGALDWADSDDDYNTGSTALGFSVTVGGVTYDHFDMDSNGYIELLTDEFDVVTNYSYGYVSGLISSDPSSTYLLAAYDDLTSYYLGYYGYKLFPDRAVFYYDTETYYDGSYDYLNNFEMILYDDGYVQWNFRYAEYDWYDYDLFSGLYLGNTGTLVELASDGIPQYQSFLADTSAEPVPEPATIVLLGIGLAGFGGGYLRRRLRQRK